MMIAVILICSTWAIYEGRRQYDYRHPGAHSTNSIDKLYRSIDR